MWKNVRRIATVVTAGLAIGTAPGLRLALLLSAGRLCEMMLTCTILVVRTAPEDAALIAHCLEHGLEAHWDAGNPTSARLAEKLGYTSADTHDMLLRIEPEKLEQ